MIDLQAYTGQIKGLISGTGDVIGPPESTATPPNSSGKVCFYGNTRFFLDKEATAVYSVEALTFLRDVALRSFNEALTRAAAGSNGKVNVLIPITQFEPHFANAQELIDFLQPVVKTYERLNVDFGANAYKTAATNFASNTDCDWFVSVKLDADDVLAPGYLDWVVQSVIPTLDRGAIVASRKLPRLNYGFGRCFVNPEKHFFKSMGQLDTCPYYNGWSVGQVRVLRRDVFLALGMPFDSDAHAVNLSVLRAGVVEKILKRAPIPLLKRDFQLVKNFTLFQDTDAEMEELTGIKMVETTEAGFGPAGIYMKTPLSSHFPFNEYPTYPECTPEVWTDAIANATMLNRIKGTFEYVYESGEKSKMTLLHLCKSSAVWRKERRSWFGMKTCEDMDQHFQTLVSWRKLQPPEEVEASESLRDTVASYFGPILDGIESFFGEINDDNWSEQGVNALKNFTLSNLKRPNMTMLQMSCRNSTTQWEKEMFSWFGLKSCEELDQPLLIDGPPTTKKTKKIVRRVKHKVKVSAGVKIIRKSELSSRGKN